ncbi:hypothetical protein T281_16045 [Rhodomicrobium udaipurense JA643]|uniref:Uncharacterized protein n=1 Tax=Rhodomicrobium udaipurense TaxID=1202716 RepID=A0A8I1GA16_9HYPH|nr:hypothetical protein [Rhodomicrobium udaipurense]KAI93544.1 hypothetical protein T281_16045 [Rhodomicrobium udaipurense JA643]MBJ7543288.1 hypothetical protein [Rhodomicrobium udaipurense]
MSDDLDLSDLTDDQLVGLARLVAAEAARRKYPVKHAARAAALDEEEKARIASLATDAEWAAIRAEERRRVEAEARAKARAEAQAKAPPPRDATQEAEWAQRKLYARMVAETLGTGWTLNVWRAREDSEVRVYLDHASAQEQRTRYGSKKVGPHAVLYVTGGRKNPPGKLEMTKIDSSARRAVQAIASLAARRWREIRIDCDDAAAAAVADLPYPSEYLAVRKNP